MLLSLLSNWYYGLRGIDPATVPASVCRLRPFRTGSYRVRIYDTWRGKWVGEELAEANDGVLTLRIPSMKRDVAFWIERHGSE